MSDQVLDFHGVVAELTWPLCGPFWRETLESSEMH
jgi:hypothetical protein